MMYLVSSVLCFISFINYALMSQTVIQYDYLGTSPIILIPLLFLILTVIFFYLYWTRERKPDKKE